jgi:hypothetical protein
VWYPLFKTWKYASIHVRRYTGSSVEGNFDITVENGVKISKQIISIFNPQGLNDLHNAIMAELESLPWLSSSKKQEKQEKTSASSKKPTSINPSNSKDIWASIEKDYDLSNRAFSRKISFVKEDFSRSILFRDVEQAYVLANDGFSKPAVILAGSVIEELLRQYLKHKKIKPDRDTFDHYITTCQENGLLKDAIHRLTDSVRHFRNLVHLAKEKNKKHTISKATAKGAVSSIFTITNDFD